MHNLRYFFFKFRDVFNEDGELVTTMGHKWWWAWTPLLPGAHYGPTRLHW